MTFPHQLPHSPEAVPLSASAGKSRRIGWLCLALAVTAGATPTRATGLPQDRIVSIGGAVTEILYGLGTGDRVAALDTTSTFPPEAFSSKPSVGYLRQISAEGVLSVRPTRVIALDTAGPPGALALIREAGVPVDLVREDPTPSGLQAKVQAVARLVGRDEAGRELAAGIGERFAALDAARARIGRPMKALFVLSLQSGRTLVGGRGTNADAMLGLAGAENVATGFDGFKPMSDEAIVAAAPDAIVMMRSGPSGHVQPDLLSGPALSKTPAGRAGRLIVMDGGYLLGFGPRAPDAALDLMRALYPALRLE